MIKKKLLIVIGALLILNLSLVGCGKSTEANTNTENSTTTSSNSSNEDKTKELDKKYIESIKPYILNISNDWKSFSEVCSTGEDVYKDTNKVKIAGYFADIEQNWKEIFNIQSEDTTDITETKKILKNIDELQEKAINEFTEGVDNVDANKIKQASESLNKSNDIINNKFVPLVNKMNNE